SPWSFHRDSRFRRTTRWVGGATYTRHRAVPGQGPRGARAERADGPPALAPTPRACPRSIAPDGRDSSRQAERSGWCRTSASFWRGKEPSETRSRRIASRRRCNAPLDLVDLANLLALRLQLLACPSHARTRSEGSSCQFH